MLDINVKDDCVYEILNARKIRVSSNQNLIQFTSIGNCINKINIGEIEHNIGDKITFNINKIEYNKEIKQITKKSNNTAIINIEITNKTTQFLLPVLGNTKEIMREEYIINTYLSYDFTSIIVKYLFIESESFIKLEKMLSQHPNLIRIDDSNNREVIYEFEIPPEYYKDIDKFTSGKYSGFSDKLKHRILSFYGFKREGDMYNILYNSPKLRKQLELDFGIEIPQDVDLYSKPNLEEEILIT